MRQQAGNREATNNRGKVSVVLSADRQTLPSRAEAQPGSAITSPKTPRSTPPASRQTGMPLPCVSVGSIVRSGQLLPVAGDRRAKAARPELTRRDPTRRDEQPASRNLGAERRIGARLLKEAAANISSDRHGENHPALAVVGNHLSTSRAVTSIYPKSRYIKCV